MIVGNHDSYYKNTNNTNSPQLLLKDYPNVKTYSSPTEIKVENLDILLLPWICVDNEQQSLKMIQKTKAKVAMGHLELQGFRVNRSLIMDMDWKQIFLRTSKRYFLAITTLVLIMELYSIREILTKFIGMM